MLIVKCCAKRIVRFPLLLIIGVTIILAGLAFRALPVAPPLTAPPVVSLPVARAAVTIGPSVARDLPFPAITAKSVAVVDGETGVLLGEKKKDLMVPIASVTKLMTALIFLETQPSWQKEITIERRDSRPGGTLFVRPGERLTLYDLFMTMLVGSANNAAVALTRAAGLSPEAFVERMNERAVAMGLSATRFVEPTGLDRENVSSALDLVRLGFIAFQDARIREALTASEHIFVTTNTQMRHRVKTTNDLLLQATDGYTLVGAKTGFTNDAGYTFLVEAKKENARVVVAVLGAATEEDRFRDADTLIRWAFERYKWE